MSPPDKKHSETIDGVAGKPRNRIDVPLRSQDDRPDDAIARTLTRPEVQAAATIQEWDGENHEVNSLARELATQINAAMDGDLKRAEGMLMAQAHTLDALFNNLACKARRQEHLNHYETFLRLALKAQSQCRTTLETLAAIKNPPVVYARQANIANQQQVNNGVTAESRAPRTRETEMQPNKVLEEQHGERLDTGKKKTPGGTDSPLEAVEPVHRTKDAERKS